MRISEVAELTGVGIDALRFYEKEGLLRPDRSKYQRTFSRQDVERLENILTLRRQDTSIPDIRRLLTWDEQIVTMQRLSPAEIGHVQRVDDFLAKQVHMLEDRRRDVDASLALFRHMREKIAWLLDHGGLSDEPASSLDHPERNL